MHINNLAAALSAFIGDGSADIGAFKDFCPT
jgi:hypothetical protein